MELGIYELPRELPNDLRIRNLQNEEISGKSQNLIEFRNLIDSSSQNENFVNTCKNPLKRRNLTFSVLRYCTFELEFCFKYFVHDYR